MDTATISTKYQIVIPQEIRNKFNIKPGQKIKFICYDNRLEIVPLIDLKELVGIFPNSDTTIDREDNERI